MDELKCKVSLKQMNTVNSVIGMLLTLNTTYGKWLGTDYKSIHKELDDVVRLRGPPPEVPDLLQL